MISSLIKSLKREIFVENSLNPLFYTENEICLESKQKRKWKNLITSEEKANLRFFSKCLFVSLKQFILWNVSRVLTDNSPGSLSFSMGACFVMHPKERLRLNVFLPRFQCLSFLNKQLKVFRTEIPWTDSLTCNFIEIHYVTQPFDLIFFLQNWWFWNSLNCLFTKWSLLTLFKIISRNR